jgi:hypothetical protein
VGFAVTRNGTDIEQVGVRDTVNTNIAYSAIYREWESIVYLGGTLTELLRWDTGEYPMWFKEKVIAFSELRKQVNLHSEDARARKMKRKRR